MGLNPNIELTHHAELVTKWIGEKKVQLAPRDGNEVTYHDPCYLSRYENIIDEPRAILTTAGADIKEPERTKSRSFCCGAGGAMLFAEEKDGTRINRDRTDELVRTGAKTVAVGCPFCSMMVRDALTDRDLQDTVQVRDIAEIAADHLP